MSKKFRLNVVGFYEGGTLRVAGCGCCEEAEPTTKENLEEAIQEVEEFLKLLKEKLELKNKE